MINFVSGDKVTLKAGLEWLSPRYDVLKGEIGIIYRKKAGSQSYWYVFFPLKQPENENKTSDATANLCYLIYYLALQKVE